MVFQHLHTCHLVDISLEIKCWLCHTMASRHLQAVSVNVHCGWGTFLMCEMRLSVLGLRPDCAGLSHVKWSSKMAGFLLFGSCYYITLLRQRCWGYDFAIAAYPTVLRSSCYNVPSLRQPVHCSSLNDGMLAGWSWC